MEADWEVEAGGDAPVIDACWPGWIDLRAAPERAAELPELRMLPELEPALFALNAPGSSVWTSKCDVWTLDAFDKDELDAPADSAIAAIACYIDLLPCASARWSRVDDAVSECRGLCSQLHATPLRCCRVDLVIRQALVGSDTRGFGITAYVTACGEQERAAASQLGQALVLLAGSVVRCFGSAETGATVQSKDMGE